jgi:hypothetical protein
MDGQGGDFSNSITAGGRGMPGRQISQALLMSLICGNQDCRHTFEIPVIRVFRQEVVHASFDGF